MGIGWESTWESRDGVFLTCRGRSLNLRAEIERISNELWTLTCKRPRSIRCSRTSSSCRCDSSNVPRTAAHRQKEEQLDVEKLVAEVAAKEVIHRRSWLREIGARVVQGGCCGRRVLVRIRTVRSTWTPRCLAWRQCGNVRLGWLFVGIRPLWPARKSTPAHEGVPDTLEIKTPQIGSELVR
jgi:hypothetical protein